MMHGHGMMHGPMGRGHRMGMHSGAMPGNVPARYRREARDFVASMETVRTGSELYRTHCAMCHGERGRGDGPAGRGLAPPPADLGFVAGMPMVDHAYLAWRIAEGGADRGTGMPPYEGVLSARDRLALASYLKAGLPPRP